MQPTPSALYIEIFGKEMAHLPLTRHKDTFADDEPSALLVIVLHYIGRNPARSRVSADMKIRLRTVMEPSLSGLKRLSIDAISFPQCVWGSVVPWRRDAGVLSQEFEVMLCKMFGSIL